MHVGHKMRPPKLTAHTGHKNRPHDEHTASAWFCAWKKQVASSPPVNSCGFVTTRSARNAGNSTNW
ncbi:hypothetical protein CKA38_12540 [Ereboglobus luteus]|uniref:Uncharacterized protein n=1 Tax=Ereboglobus luteus TaxID=1796921 RepID=A0A2U8E5Y2_9BACT|nr:hypothetical protein CKA38_12540 [Ereboglobus luteus]